MLRYLVVGGVTPGGAPAAPTTGITVVGGLAGGVLGFLGYCRLRGWAPGRPFDLVAAAMPLAQAIGRLGCFAAGCCAGRPTSSWLGMTLPDETGVWCRRFPTQLISAAADVVIFLLLIGFE